MHNYVFLSFSIWLLIVIFEKNRFSENKSMIEYVVKKNERTNQLTSVEQSF